MEVSEPIKHFPLDFSINMNIKLNGINNENNCVNGLTSVVNNNNNNNNSSSSAFKVVTPKGKTDGKTFSWFFFSVNIYEVCHPNVSWGF